jgi:hypothetical protein
MLQPPQLEASFWKLTHSLPHCWRPGEQDATHCPARQVCPSPQALLHAPQLKRSFCGSTQPSPHWMKPLSQALTQFPRSHRRPPWQDPPQLPQWAGSDEVSTQVPLHSCAGATHVHAPATQASLSPQA